VKNSVNGRICKPIDKSTNISMMSYIGDLQGCGTIRIIHPSLLLNHYKHERNNVKITFESYYSSFFIREPKYYVPITFIQFQRASTENHLKIVNEFINEYRKPTKTPIIYEIDDLLLDIEEWNYAHNFYKPLTKYIEEIMRLVDGITVSTYKLKEVYSKYNQNINVIPNHLPKYIWGEPIYTKADEYRKKNPRILYHGSMNHFAVSELTPGKKGGDFSEELLDFIRKTVDKYNWIFMGGFPEELADLKGNKIEYIPWSNVFSYAHVLKSINPDFGIAPLYYNLFNQCKSNIKMLEYCAMGVPAIYTNIDPYYNGTVKASSTEEMISHIEEFAKDPDLRYKSWKLDLENNRSQLFWEEQNNLIKYINSYLSLFGIMLPK